MTVYTVTSDVGIVVSTPVSEPVYEYYKTLNYLKQYRKACLNILLRDRVEKQFDSRLQALDKYISVAGRRTLSGKFIKPIGRRLYAYKWSGFEPKDALEAPVTATYTGVTQVYQLPEDPSNTKELPQVDVFIYTLPSDSEILSRLGLDVLRQTIVIRATKDSFYESPDFENALFDYYHLDIWLHPKKAHWISFVNPVSVGEIGQYEYTLPGNITISEATGTKVTLRRKLNTPDQSEWVDITVTLLYNAHVKWSDGSELADAILLRNATTKSSGFTPPETLEVYVIGWWFKAVEELGVYQAIRWGNRIYSWRKVADGVTEE